MLLLRRPTAETIQTFLTAQAPLPFSYSAVGATATTPLAGYDVDLARIKLGEGEQVFAAAKTALQSWQHFRLPWVETWPPNTPLQKGAVVAVLAHVFGLWWLNACRVIYYLDEEGPVRRFGFAYGTLPDHIEKGEERFLVEWDTQDGSVWYDILAFSRPRHPLAWLGYPLARRLQARFRRESAEAMLRAVGSVPLSVP
jgi:uncharacterized protein (UPF0548 family)